MENTMHLFRVLKLASTEVNLMVISFSVTEYYSKWFYKFNIYKTCFNFNFALNNAKCVLFVSILEQR